MEKWYQQSTEEVLKRRRSRRSGLTETEVARIRETAGENALKETSKKTVVQVFLAQFRDLMVLILLLAAALSALTGDGKSTLVILAVLFLNALLGTLQQKKAERSLDSLKMLAAPRARVLREGSRREIPSREVVPGDILLLEAGDLVTADGRILEQASLQVNESSLTGEALSRSKQSEPLEGEVPLADRTNMVYSGSLVTYGRASVVVTEIGMGTEIGRIAQLLNDTKERKTPLQESLDQFSGRLALVILMVSGLVFALTYQRGTPLMDSLLFAVALAVAAIPEALSSIVTIVQAMGTQKMARENAIIKNLAAVETLGSVSVICSDKTGTLTQNRMTVQEIYVGGELLRPERLNLKNSLHRYLLYDAILANDADLSDGRGIGDPTEAALLEILKSIKEFRREGTALALSIQDLREMLPREEELPFDSDRKLMTTRQRIRGVSTLFTKGALEILLERCTSIRMGDFVRALTEQDRQEIAAQNERFSEQGLRVLAFAYKETQEKLTPESEYGMTFLGMVSMMDPPRKESIHAVQEAKRAGIRTVMITGDHRVTAKAIAEQIGIFREGDLVRTGTEVDAMSEQELSEQIERISVYARVSPENKLRIVRAWQHAGKIVAMTGDGVNDAPALKKADIGVAMGVTGTEVSKDAAAMILTDDNFATILRAVANGRSIYQNLRNSILFLLSGNLSAILTVLYTSFLALPIPFQAVQLLFVNLVTDSLPALAIGMEPGDETVLNRPPRDVKKGMMDRDFVKRLVLQGGLLALCVITSYSIGLETGPRTACTMAFVTLTLARLLHGFNCRGTESLFQLGFRRNWYSLAAFVLGFALLMMVCKVPGLREVFAVVPLTYRQMRIVAGMSAVPTFVIQVVRIVKERHSHL